MSRKIFIYIYTFFVIYMPRMSDLLIGIPIEFLSIFFLIILVIHWLLVSKNNQSWPCNKRIFFLVIGLTGSSIYFLIRALFEGEPVRILQNNFIVIQLLHLLFIIKFMKSINYSRDDMIKVLLNLGVFQGVLCILMLIVPSFREVALNLYYMGREENIFISQMRIFGISGDYTFFTPIYHGMLATVAFIYAVCKHNRFFLYIPFLLLAIILNGRFGLIIFFIGICMFLLYLLYKKRVSVKLLKYIFLLFILISFFLPVIQTLSPYTYNWIVSGFEDVLNLVMHNERSGNFGILEEMWFFPTGIYLIIGRGYRVFGESGRMRGYSSSDIGYVNDLFMGGIIYILILYGTIFKFILSKEQNSKYTSYNDIFISNFLSLFLVVTLIVSNYKGEVMRSGLILVGAIFIKLILMQSNSSKV